MLSTLHRRFAIQSVARIFVVLLALAFMTAGLSPTAQADSQDLAGKTIVVDAGHGGPDAGASSATGIEEKDITLNVAKQLAVLLRQGGARVVLTRESDDDLATDLDRQRGRRQRTDLTKRLAIARAAHPDLFVSIHCNSTPSSAWRGAQVLYMKGNRGGKRAADSIQVSFRENLLETNRTAAAVSSLFLLKRIHTPAVLAEIGFLSNPEEAYRLNTQPYQQQVAFALYTGILSYFDAQSAGWGARLAQIFHTI